MSALSMRSGRMELKTTDDTKNLLCQAAALDGMDLTAFVLGPAIDKARRVLREHASISLSREGQMALVKLLRAPKKASTPAMRKLMELPDLKEREA